MRYVYCHPLFDERKCSHRFSYHLKARFQSKGILLERFDYRGTGEAVGEFADVSLASLREDVARYINGDEACLIGVRFGAALAADYCAGGLGPAPALVLVEPVVYGRRYVDCLYRKQHIKNLMTGNCDSQLCESGYENLEGYKTSRRFLREMSDFNLLEVVGKQPIKGTVYIVQISSQPKIRSELSELLTTFERWGSQSYFETVDAPAFWERIPSEDYSAMTKKICRWCRV